MAELFPELVPPADQEQPRAEKLSPDRARTQRAAQRIARGIHPFGLKLRTPAGETCGGCKHLHAVESNTRRAFFKCDLRGDSRGPGTDCRKKWPACEKWEAAPGHEPIIRRPASADERALSSALARCSFSAGTFDKRFARDLNGQLQAPDAEITEKQAALLRKLVTRYRRQISEGSIPAPERHLLEQPKAVRP